MEESVFFVGEFLEQTQKGKTEIVILYKSLY